MQIPILERKNIPNLQTGTIRTNLPRNKTVNLEPLEELLKIKSEELEVSELNQALTTTFDFLRERKNNQVDGYFTRKDLLAVNSTQEYAKEFDDIVKKQSESIKNSRVRKAYLSRMEQQKISDLNQIANYEREQLMFGRQKTMKAAQEEGIQRIIENKDNPDIIEEEIKNGLNRIDADNFLNTKQNKEYKQSAEIIKSQKQEYVDNALSAAILSKSKNDPKKALEALGRYKERISSAQYIVLEDKVNQHLENRITDEVSTEALSLYNEDSERAKEYIEKNIPNNIRNKENTLQKTTQAYFLKLSLFQKTNNEQKRLNHERIAEQIDKFFEKNDGTLLNLYQNIENIQEIGTKKAFEKYISSSGFIHTDTATYIMLSNMATEDKRNFINLDLTHYIDKLNKADRKRLKEVQNDLIEQSNGKKGSGKYTEFLSSNDHLKYFLQLRGIEKEDENYLEEYVKSASLLEKSVNEFEQNDLKGTRKANASEIGNIILKLAGNFKYDRVFIWDKDVKLPQFRGKSVKERAKIYQPFEKIALKDLIAIQNYVNQHGINGNPEENSNLKELYEKLYPALLTKDLETVEFLIDKHKGL